MKHFELEKNQIRHMQKSEAVQCEGGIALSALALGTLAIGTLIIGGFSYSFKEAIEETW